MAKRREETRKQLMSRLNMVQNVGGQKKIVTDAEVNPQWQPPTVYTFGVKNDQHRAHLLQLFENLNVCSECDSE